MFTNTRNKLTWLNTLLTVSLLVAFVLLSFYSLRFFLTYTRQADIKSALQQEVDERLHKHKSEEKRKSKEDKEDKDEEDRLIQHGYFLYTFDASGSLIEHHQLNFKLSQSIIDQLSQWKPEKMEYRSITLSVDDHTYRYLVGGVSYVKEREQQVVMLGIDMGLEDMILERYAFILAMFTLVFSVGYFFAGRYLSARAIQPIIRSYERQKAFTSDASHELRTPLSVLQSSVEVLETEPQTDFSKELITDIKDEIRRMTALVQNLLTLARLDQGAIHIKKEQVDMNQIAKQIERLFQMVAVHKELTLSVVCQEGLEEVWGDRDRIVQLIEILLDNAMKFTFPKGEVNLTIEKWDNQEVKGIRILVDDTGCGIPADELSQIFERFYKSDRSRKRDHSGSGLGLAIAKMIVEAHHGTITVSSVEGQGTQFVVWLPSTK